MTVPKLFANNSSGKLGLVGYWDVVAFDEFAGKQKKVDKALVDIIKNYMANKSFSRGVETFGAEASMVFIGNTQHTVPYMLKHADLFDELPDKFYDSAFLDRLHYYIPGWEVDIIRGEMFSSNYGFVVDYLAEILRAMRNHDYSDRYKAHFTLSSDLSTRDRDGINKTFSGLMKILYPQGEASKDEIEEILKFAIEGRKRVKDQLMRIDTTYPKVRFTYEDHSGQSSSVSTLEEESYPGYYYKTIADTSTGTDDVASNVQKSPLSQQDFSFVNDDVVIERHRIFQENQKGIFFDDLFGPYLRGASKIIVTDPYIRMFYQVRNFMEFLETVVKFKEQDEEVAVHLVTSLDDFKGDQQQEHFEKIKESCTSIGVDFSWEFDASSCIHARHIITDHGWKILLDRGLDVYQYYDANDAFTFANRLQQQRFCKAFEVTYIKNTLDEN